MQSGCNTDTALFKIVSLGEKKSLWIVTETIHRAGRQISQQRLIGGSGIDKASEAPIEKIFPDMYKMRTFYNRRR